MDNLEKFNSEKLNRAEMKQVQGGGLIDSAIGVLNDIVVGASKVVNDLNDNLISIVP
jgi:hypothetical protein